ncbi:MAG: hypothetical protein R3C14_37570 [Caldilineaceae bacterium]
MSTESTEVTLTELAPGVAYGNGARPGWQMLAATPLVILVGVTGVGKSTTLEMLQAQAWEFTLLPDRRTVTDQLIIDYMQAIDGAPRQPERDRSKRFAYTRRYHELFPGGMAHALSQIQVDGALVTRRILFDGLRGEAEVTHAAQALPHARFVVLDAPDIVRVRRLLGRSDAFDKISLATANATTASAAGLASIGVAGADELFTSAEVAELLALAAPPVGAGTVAVADLRAKVQIVVEERRNYDPQAARAYLCAHYPQRTLVIDTVKHDAAAVAQRIIAWLP